MAPKISIIIPTLNEAAIIDASLRYLQPLRPDCELILVDGGSTDETIILAKPLVDLVLSAPPGRAIQMNVGAQQAKSPLLLFLHADTQLPAQFLQLFGNFEASHLCWGRFDISLISRHPLVKIISLMMNWRSRITGICTGDQAMFVRRDAFEAVGRFTEIALMEDIDLSNKLKHLSPPYCIQTKVHSSARRWHTFGPFKMMLLMWSLRLRFYLGVTPEKLAALYNQGRFF